jgi:hypothetical protein
MVHLSTQCVTTLACIHCRWTTKTNCSLALGAHGAFWIMQSGVYLSEIGQQNGGGSKVLKGSSGIRKIAMNICCQAHNLTTKA